MPEYNMTLEVARTVLVWTIGLYIAILLFQSSKFKKVVDARRAQEGSIIVKGNVYPSWYLIGRRHMDSTLVMLCAMSVFLIALNIPIMLGAVGIPKTSVPHGMLSVVGAVVFVLILALAYVFKDLDKKYGKLLVTVKSTDFACVGLASAAMTLNSFVSTGYFSS